MCLNAYLKQDHCSWDAVMLMYFIICLWSRKIEAAHVFPVFSVLFVSWGVMCQYIQMHHLMR